MRARDSRGTCGCRSSNTAAIELPLRAEADATSSWHCRPVFSASAAADVCGCLVRRTDRPTGRRGDRAIRSPVRAHPRRQLHAVGSSPLIEALKLNERFEFRVRTLLTWEVPPAAASTSASATAATTSGWRRRRPTPVPPRMRADTTIEVDVATPPLFAWIPRPVLEGIATGATTLVLDSLRRSFLRNLAKDYERWATDRGYREERARVGDEVAVTKSKALFFMTRLGNRAEPEF